VSDVCAHQQPHTTCRRCHRARLAQDIAVVVDELAVAVHTHALVDPHAIPGWKAPTDGRPTPSKVRYETTDLGLIAQLAAAAGIRPTRGIHPEPTDTPQLVEASWIRGPRYGADTTSHPKPGSRPPGSLDAIDAFARITTGIRALRCDAHTDAGRRTITRPAPIARELEHLAWITAYHHTDGRPAIGDDLARRIRRDLRAYASEARIVLSYEAPVVALRVRCPDCGGEMRVREDATSDVWCTGHLPVEGPARRGKPMPVTYPCAARWSRFTWIQLLDQTTQEANA